MAYVKPNTFVNGTPLTADDLNGNDEALKTYVNQEIVQGDLDNNHFKTQDIQVGDYDPIVNNYTFATGIDTGLANGRDPIDRSYFTSNIKASRQTDNNLLVWLTMPETAPHLILEQDAEVIITVGSAWACTENDVEPVGFWDSDVYLTYINVNDLRTLSNQTYSYAFEEAVLTNTPAGNKNPFGGAGLIPDVGGAEGPAGATVAFAVRRWIGFTAHFSLTAGSYRFAVVVNPKVQRGFTSARVFKAEVFYK